jgi:hypothetical protein
VHLLEHSTAVPGSRPVAPSTTPTRPAPARPELPLPPIVRTPLTSKLADTAQGVTTTLGDSVTRAGNGLGDALAPASKPAGSLVKGLTSGLGGTVTVIGQSVAGLLRVLTPSH